MERPALAEGVEALCAGLLPADTARNRTSRTAIQVLLGQATGEGEVFLRWPLPSEAAEVTTETQTQISSLLRRQAKLWLSNQALSEVRDEIVLLLDARGAVMYSVELAEALIAGRGSYTPEPKRLPQAVGLVRAAVEAETCRGGDARLAIHRFPGSDTVLVGREPNDAESTITAADLLDYVVRLGARAAELVAGDLLPTRQRAVDELRVLPMPDEMPALGDLRLLQLAAAGSHDRADVNPQGQLYPVGMSAERALRAATGSLVGQRLSVDAVRSRVRVRFPRAVALPDRPDLDDLLTSCDVPLIWYPDQQGYAPRGVSSSLTGTRMAQTLSPLLKPDAVAEADAKLAATIDRDGFLVLLAPMRRLAHARAALLTRLRLTEVDITAIMLDQLRALGFPWEAIIAADNGNPTDVDFRSLVELVQHDVMPTITEALADAGPVLITEASPLVRYGQHRLFQQLADPARPRRAARLLLVPARRPEPAMLDDWQLPLTSYSSQALWLPEGWAALAMEKAVGATARSNMSG